MIMALVLPELSRGNCDEGQCYANVRHETVTRAALQSEANDLKGHGFQGTNRAKCEA